MQRLGRYEIVKELGRGAMGTVYRARDPKIDRVVALKTISITGASAAEEAEYRQRFFREAQAAGKLSHPGLVVIHDVGEDEATRTPFIVMEFIEGRSLEEMARAERLAPPQALELAKQVAEALDYAHSRKIIHRDIKPANIMVTEEGRAKITDFGIAKVAMTQMTQTGQVLGTPAYMSPEQLSGGAVDGRADLFSLGVILYWLLTGEKPFAGDTTTAVSFKIVYQDPIPASRLNPTLSPDYDYVINRALAKDPNRRYQRGRELGEDLEDLLRGQAPRSRAALGITGAEVEHTIVAQPRAAAASPDATVKRPAAAVAAAPAVAAPPKRRKWLAAAAVVVVLFLLGGLGWWWTGSSAPDEGEEGESAAQEATTSTPPPSTSQPARSEPSRQTRSQPSQPKTTSPPPPSPSTSDTGSSQPPVAEPRTRPTRTVQQATLQLTGEHNFESATLYLYVDEKLLRQYTLRSRAAGRSGKIKPGKISGSASVRAGAHTISVRVVAPRDGFDQIKYIDGKFNPGQTRTLEITFGKLSKIIALGELTRNLELRWLN